MKGDYIKRIQKLSEKLSDPALAERARKINSNSFSRNRKMSLRDVLMCCLSKKGLTTTMELRNYFKQKDDLCMRISKQGYLQQRKRLNPEVFSYLNDEYLTDFYDSSEPIFCRFGTALFQKPSASETVATDKSVAKRERTFSKQNGDDL